MASSKDNICLVEGNSTPYLTKMRKPHQTPEQAQAKRAYVSRGARIRSGETPGLFESGAKKIRPEVRLLIDEALAKRRENSCGT